VHAERIKYMFISCYQNAGHNHNLMTVNNGIKCRLNLGLIFSPEFFDFPCPL